VTAVEGLLLLGVSVAAWPLRRQRPELRALIPLMIVTLILQSGMGAWAVRSPQTPAVMASHFGISLLCFAATFLTWRVLREPAAARTRPRSLAAPPGFRVLAWSTLAFSVGVAYLGAYVRHTNSELACYTWPDCNGELLPALSGRSASTSGTAWRPRWRWSWSASSPPGPGACGRPGPTWPASAPSPSG
jgi:cytochrome c oxidase assembly protein subunit 15